MFVTSPINCNNCLSYSCKGKYRFSYLFTFKGCLEFEDETSDSVNYLGFHQVHIFET